MERVAAYRAQDGKLFETPEDCLEYEFEITWTPQIVEFLQSPLNKYTQGTTLSIARNVIVAWERFKEKRATFLDETKRASMSKMENSMKVKRLMEDLMSK
jgi:hypothetical protein